MPFRLAHLSDAHIGPLPLVRKRELIGKRLTGYMNWKSGRGRAHDMPLLARMVADIRAQTSDHIAMTGDILNIGLPAEFPFAKAWLETLGPSADVSFTPGNHDAYVKSSMAPLTEAFALFTGSDGADAAPGYPFLRVRGGVALIGLCSGVPTLPFIAGGKIGRAQRARLAGLLKETGARGLCRVVLLHHPPHRTGAPAARGLFDAPAVEAVLAGAGAELVLHGHNHVVSIAHLDGASGPIPIVGVPSASSAGKRRAGWHLFEIGGAPGHWRIEARARGPLPDSGEIGDLGPLRLQA